MEKEKDIEGFAMSTTLFDFNTHLPYQMARTTNLISQITIPHYLEQISNTQNISARAFRVIVIVAKFGPISPASVATKTGLDRATVTRACSELQRGNLIKSIRNTKDGRSKFLVLTSNGAHLCDSLFPLMQERGDFIGTALTENEKTVLTSLLNKIREKITEHPIKP